MKYISEFEILDQYQIQETTLSHLQNLGLLPESKSKRGRLVYPLTKALDLTLRTAKVFYHEVATQSLRLLPCFRAFLALAISDGAKAAWSMMKRRGFFDRYDQQDLVDRWKAFKAAVPKELMKFVKGESDDVTPAVEAMLKILGVEDPFYSPEKLKMPEIYDSMAIQQDVDALLLAGARPSLVTEIVSRLHHTEVSPNVIEDYRYYYFDTALLTGEDFAQHLKRFPPTSSYRKLLAMALTERSLTDFITQAEYPVRISIEEALGTVLTPLLKQIRTKSCGPLTARDQTNATRNAMHIMDALEKHTAEEDAVGDDYGDMLRLRHDVAVNANQLIATDIPEEDFDTSTNSYRRDDQADESAGDSA
jgi:hypothetical protein